MAAQLQIHPTTPAVLSHGSRESDVAALRIGIALAHFHPTVGGQEGQLFLLAQHWAELGHKPIVFTRSIRGKPARETVAGIEIRRVIRTVSIGPLFGATFLTSLIAALIRFRRHYDILFIGQVPWEAAAAGFLPSFLRRPTAVLTATTGPMGDLAQLSSIRGAAQLARWIRRNQRFLAYSAEAELEWRDFGVEPEHIARVTAAVKPEVFYPPAAPDSRDHQAVLFVGRLVPQKDPHTLLDAWGELHPAGGQTLSIVGAGHLRGELESLARMRSLVGVNFRGQRSDLADLYRRHGVFVLPSRGEGCPNALLEAMASGCAVVASAIGGIQDIVEDGVNGLLVPPGDPNALATALRRVLDDSALRSRLGRAARETILRDHEPLAVARRYLDIFFGLRR